MCGIIGSFSPKGNVCADDILIRMRDSMTHRGPDGGGIWREPEQRCVLGHRRLSIIDLSQQASQPMMNQDRSVIIIFNGEIYNHAELRRELEQTGKYRWQTDHSDTEVILHAYEEWNLDALNKFYGMFAIAIYDRRNPERPVLHLIRDRIGIKPLYLTKTERGEWLFGSEIRALLAHPDVHTEMDKTAFWHYLTFIVTPAPLTLFRNIWKIPAGHGVTIDHTGEANAWQWWDCQPSIQNTLTEKDLSFDEAADQLLNLSRKAISRRMVADVPFGVLLSGGVDSSLNVALMSELMDRPVDTFTVGYESHEQFNEFHYAQQLSKRYQTHHHETRIKSQDVLDFFPLLVQLQDEPIADNVCIPLYFLSKLVKESGTTVVQVGEGADENFLGYWWCDHYLQKYQNVYQPALSRKNTLWDKLLGRNSKNGVFSSQEDRDISKRALNNQEMFWGGAVCWWGEMRDQLTPNNTAFQQELNCPVKNLLPKTFQQLDSHEVVAHYLKKFSGKLTNPEILQKITYMELKLRLPEHLLMRVDKMTMAHSIEARVPFLDHDIVEFAMRLPLSYKLDKGLGKKILKKIAEPFVDNDLLYRRKQGFGAPMEHWFMETTFGKKCLDVLERSDLLKQGYFDSNYVMNFFKKNISQGGGYSFHMWTIMNAVLWYEVWIKGNKDCL